LPPALPAPPEKPREAPVPPARPVLSTAGEVELVEQVAVARESYRLTLEALKRHYFEAGNATKLAWAEKELADLNGMEKYHYLSEVELAPADLRPVASITAADLLFKEGLEFKNYPAFPPEKKEKLRTALTKFRTIITDYPMSDKIDDAAFRMGEIYEGWYFEDPVRAVQCYERCFQWSPRTEYPAIFNTAKLYDEKLMQRDKAVELYNKVIQQQQTYQNQKPEHVDFAVRRLTELKPIRQAP
jgi:tetratricopeptide (TPR) repeat protein